MTRIIAFLKICQFDQKAEKIIISWSCCFFSYVCPVTKKRNVGFKKLIINLNSNCHIKIINQNIQGVTSTGKVYDTFPLSQTSLCFVFKNDYLLLLYYDLFIVLFMIVCIIICNQLFICYPIKRAYDKNSQSRIYYVRFLR